MQKADIWIYVDETIYKNIKEPLYWSIVDVQYYMSQVYNIVIHNF